ncbi:MAG TPA: TonB-dependent receptor [Burkholderiales bacterium]|nr:TonB-dependent receptor [Burkholderiales bacterium]
MKCLLPAVLAGFAIALPSQAQDTKDKDLVAPEVVVTATRFEEPQSGHPLGTQVITRPQIEASNAQTIQDVLITIGGLHARDNGRSNPQLDLRGFGVSGDQNTLVLVNGRKISEIDLQPANLAAVPLSSVERIEILRGGGAVLYGGGATGGTINIITRVPTPGERSGYLQAGAGSYDAWSAQAGLQVAGESVGLGLAARRFDTEGYRDNGADRQDTIDASVTLNGAAGRFTLGFGKDAQDTRLPGALSRSQIAIDRRATVFPDDFASLDTEYVSAAWTRAFGIVELTADASHRESEGHGSVGGGQSNYHNRSTLVSPRARIANTLWGMKNSLVFGVDWEGWDYDSLTVFPGFDADTTSIQETSAVYAQNTLNVSERTAITIGARSQRSRTEIQSRDTFTPAGTTAQTVQPKAYEVALRQGIGSGWNLSLKAGGSFRLATVDENRGQAVPLAPQTSRDREAGIEYDSDGRRLKLSAYRMSVSDEIHFMFITGGPFGLFGSNVNLPPTRHEGLELEGQLPLLPSLRLLGRLEWRRAQFRAGTFGGVDVSGKDVPLVPDKLASLVLSWQPADAWNLTGAVRYVGGQRFDNDQNNAFPEKMPAYTLVDLKASRSYRHWLFSAELNNAFGEEYFSYGIVNGPGTSYSAYPEAQQSFLLRAEYRFGS